MAVWVQKGIVTLTEELATSSALATEARFIVHGVDQILANMGRSFWPEMARG